MTSLKAALHCISHPAKFGSHKHCSSGDVFLVCCVISQNDVIILSCKCMGLKASHHHAKFYSHKHCGSRDLIVLVCHVISLDNVI